MAERRDWLKRFPWGARRLLQFGTERDDDGAALGDALDFALKDAKFRRVDQIVGGVDGEERRADLSQIRTGIVVPGAFDLVQDVIGVGSLHLVGDILIQNRVAILQGRHCRLADDGVLALLVLGCLRFSFELVRPYEASSCKALRLPPKVARSRWCMKVWNGFRSWRIEAC